MRARVERLLHLLCVLLLVVLSGCDEAAIMKKMTPAEDESRAKSYIDLLRQGKFESIEQAMDPGIQNSGLRDTLTRMAVMIPAGDPESVKVVGMQIHRDQNISTTFLTFEYQFPSQWLLIQLALQKKDGASTIVGFHVTPISDSLEHANRFTLVGKSGLQYLIFALVILIPLFILYALILCIRTKPLKRKWLWIIFILIGWGKFGVNWTTDEWFATPLAFQIPSIAAAHGLYGPWMVAVSFPLGAVWFLAKRKKSGSPTDTYTPMTAIAPPGSPSSTPHSTDDTQNLGREAGQ